MDETILASMKQMLGIEASQTAFDSELIMHLNAQFSHLAQLGVGDGSFLIRDGTETWTDYLGDDSPYFANVPLYLYTAIRCVFDPPSSGFAMTALQDTQKECEFRITITASELNK